MERNIRFHFENIVFDAYLEVSNFPEILLQDIFKWTASWGGVPDGSQPLIESDDQELMITVRWPTIGLDIGQVNADPKVAVLSVRAPRILANGQVAPVTGVSDTVPSSQTVEASEPAQQEDDPPSEEQLCNMVALDAPPQSETVETDQTQDHGPPWNAATDSKGPDPHEMDTLDLDAISPLATASQGNPVSVCFLDEQGEPLVDRGFLWQPDSGRDLVGRTSNQGLVVFRIKTRETGWLSLFRSPETGDSSRWRIEAGELFSTASANGVQIRLNHLGFGGAAQIAGRIDDPGLNQFQLRFGLPAGPLDQSTRTMLARVFRDPG